MIKTLALAVVSVLAAQTSYASNDCSMLNQAEAEMIKNRANFYIEVLTKNNTLKEAKGTAFWHRETQKIKTLKMEEEGLAPIQLDALSRAGCQPWQGAAFNMNLNAAITGSALRIFSESKDKNVAFEKLTRLSAVKKLALIPPDLKSSE